jgi:peptide/nickel transport system substrate-binding protein
VKYTFERILDPKTASSYAPLYDTIDSVEVTGDTQVSVDRVCPLGPFLSKIAAIGVIVYQTAVEAADPARNPVGTGPFQFVEWVEGDHVTLK